MDRNHRNLGRTLVCSFVALASIASAQTVIDKGGDYNFSIYNSNPRIACILVKTTEPVTISGWYWSAGNAITSTVPGTQITVRHAVFQGLNPESLYLQPGSAILISQPKSLVVTNCDFTQWYCALFAYGPCSGSFIQARYNKVTDMTGAMSNGRGGWLGTTEEPPASGYQDDGGGGGAFEIQYISGLSGDISNNEIWNGRPAHCGDAINIYDCQAYQTNHFIVLHNLIYGVVPHNYTASCTSSAITTDGNPSAHQVCWYIDVISNYAVHCTGGIGLAYGQHCLCKWNVNVSDNLDPLGQLYNFWTTGIGAYRCGHNNHFVENYSATNSGAGTPQQPRDDFDDTIPGIPPWGTWRNNLSLWPGQVVTKEMEKEAINQWRKQINQAGITIGAYP